MQIFTEVDVGVSFQNFLKSKNLQLMQHEQNNYIWNWVCANYPFYLSQNRIWLLSVDGKAKIFASLRRHAGNSIILIVDITISTCNNDQITNKMTGEYS